MSEILSFLVRNADYCGGDDSYDNNVDHIRGGINESDNESISLIN